MKVPIEKDNDDDDESDGDDSAFGLELDNPQGSHTFPTTTGTTSKAALYEEFPSTPLHHRVEYQLWDTAGQERYASLAPMYYRGAAAAIVVYDLTNRTSFDRLKRWVAELDAKGPADLVLALCGNKLDSLQNRQVSSEEASDYALSVRASLYVETSAQDDLNIEEMFRRLGSLVLAQRKSTRSALDESDDMRRAENGGQLDAIDRSFRLDGMKRSKYNTTRKGCCVAKL
uniref:Uncharacterized protein n=1 Tax=Grammatophora oceanica TaxID=210454 RepID=A0A7S1YJ90_9STRA